MGSSTHRIAWARLVGLAAALALAGCQGLRTEAVTADDDGPITVWRLTQRDGLSIVRGYAAAIDLTDPRVEVVVTGPQALRTADADGDAAWVRLEATDAWASRQQLTLAINANYFGQIDPQAGTAQIIGLCVSDGRRVSPARAFAGRGDPALALSDGRARVALIAPGEEASIEDAVAGIGGSPNAPGTFGLLVDDAANRGHAARVDPHRRHPRTAAGVDVTGRRLLLVVIDGRQRFWSRGMTLPQLADLMIQIGAYDAVNLDGGGSSSFWYFDAEAGAPTTITNRPSDGRFRPVANHLGIRLADAAAGASPPAASPASTDLP